jgi:hypothetical protein
MGKRYEIGTTVMVVNMLKDDFQPATVTDITKDDGEDCYTLRFMDNEEGCYGHDELVYVSDDPLVVDGKPLFWTLCTVAHVQERELGKRPDPIRQRRATRLKFYIEARLAVETYFNGEPSFALDRAMHRLVEATEALEADLVQSVY